MTKTQRFFDCCLDIDRLTTRITTYLQEHGFEVAISKDKGNPHHGALFRQERTGS
ncbi:hypothetical protein QVH35_09290 [Candidatus Nitrosotenuis chungbukensis]|uniref:hypothetical protein n=1 Tax=Candidatus Nitrosotenuis chungbukensis TaxID=1353246 RepID=UPI0026718277|nr:hypothetical protein [Candidatus Nitrosotenuis chungbukensis]WKT57545.1 hypothetical protein QVH35_09290 [Candidatus Nitrosotenuis chungbukensis]